jgi:hypothetical protein
VKQAGDDLGVGEAGVQTVEHADEEVGGDLGQRAGVPGAADRSGQPIEPGAGGGRFLDAQPGTGDGHGAGRIQPVVHRAFAHRAFVAAAGVLGVDRQDGSLEPGGQLPGGPAGGRWDVAGAEAVDLFGRQPGGVQVVGEDPCLGAVDAARRQRGEHQWELLDEPLGQVQLPIGGGGRPGQRGGDFTARPLVRLDGPRDPAGGTDIAAGDLVQRREQLSLLVRQLSRPG